MLVCSGPISKKKKNYFGRWIHLHMNLGRHFLGEFDFFASSCFASKINFFLPYLLTWLHFIPVLIPVRWFAFAFACSFLNPLFICRYISLCHSCQPRNCKATPVFLPNPTAPLLFVCSSSPL